MAISLKSGRQEVIAAHVPFSLEDFDAAGSTEVAVEIPQNAIVVGGYVNITTAFDSGTSDALTVGDGDDADRYAAGVDAQATGATDLTVTGYKYDTADSVDITFTPNGTAATQGEGELVVQYIVVGRAAFSHG